MLIYLKCYMRLADVLDLDSTPDLLPRLICTNQYQFRQNQTQAKSLYPSTVLIQSIPFTSNILIIGNSFQFFFEFRRFLKEKKKNKKPIFLAETEEQVRILCRHKAETILNHKSVCEEKQRHSASD